jgi:hypothetical protein
MMPRCAGGATPNEQCQSRFVPRRAELPRNAAYRNLHAKLPGTGYGGLAMLPPARGDVVTISDGPLLTGTESRHCARLFTFYIGAGVSDAHADASLVTPPCTGRTISSIIGGHRTFSVRAGACSGRERTEYERTEHQRASNNTHTSGDPLQPLGGGLVCPCRPAPTQRAF